MELIIKKKWIIFASALLLALIVYLFSANAIADKFLTQPEYKIEKTSIDVKALEATPSCGFDFDIAAVQDELSSLDITGGFANEIIQLEILFAGKNAKYISQKAKIWQISHENPYRFRIVCSTPAMKSGTYEVYIKAIYTDKTEQIINSGKVVTKTGKNWRSVA